MTATYVGDIVSVPPGSMKAFDVGGNKILVANIDGKFYAMNRICTHRGGDLSEGILEGKIVTCPRHHSRFDVTTGEAVSGPVIGFLKLRTKDEQVYPVNVEGGRILVDI